MAFAYVYIFCSDIFCVFCTWRIDKFLNNYFKFFHLSKYIVQNWFPHSHYLFDYSVLDDGVNDEEEAQADNLELGLLAPSLLVLAAAANSANFFDTSLFIYF